MGGCDTISTKRPVKSSTISESTLSVGSEPLASVHHLSKISKRSKTPASTTTRSDSRLMNTTIDDLPDVVLIDILCRLPCYDFVFNCKSVCKRWSILMSDPYFIGRFLFRLQSHHTLIPLCTLINQKGENFPIVYNPPPHDFVTRMLSRLMSSLSLKRMPVVVGACNDLVLCCASEYFQRDYFICNPYTNQSVALPPVSRVLHNVPVGFVCDPYYNEMQQPRSTIIPGQCLIDINVDYRCMVVRILPYDDTYERDLSYQFKVEIFSFAIGEWRESVISFPKRFKLDDINTKVHFARSEMLYWSSIWGGVDEFLIELNPFMINDVNNSNTIRTSSSSSRSNRSEEYYQQQCRYIELIVNDARYDKYLCLNNCELQSGVVQLGEGGYLELCLLDSNHSVHIWELKNKEDDLIIAPNGTGKLYSKHLSLHLAKEMQLMCIDPNNEGYLYVRLNGCHFKLVNLHTGLSYDMNIPEEGRIVSNYCFFPLKGKPWWPTPVPRLPHRSP